MRSRNQPEPRRDRKPPVRTPQKRQAPEGYLTIEEWGREVGHKRTAAYAAVRRGEVPTEDYGMQVIRKAWREEAAKRAEAQAEARRRHADKRKPQGDEPDAAAQ